MTRDTARDYTPAGRTSEQEAASGRTAKTPAVVLGSVIGVVTVLVAIGLVLAVIAYRLA